MVGDVRGWWGGVVVGVEVGPLYWLILRLRLRLRSRANAPLLVNLKVKVKVKEPS